MITGMHIMINSTDPAATAAFLREKLGLPSFDAGGGFMIFEAPELELANHEADGASYDISFFCDDIEATKAELEGRGVTFTDGIGEETWGRTANFALPDGRSVLLYERKYARGKPVG